MLVNDNKHNLMDKTTKNILNEEIERKLINLIENKFSVDGFQKISMNQLAKELHISKKTIYKNFILKENLIRKVLVEKISFAYTIIITNIQAKSNIVEKFVELSHMIQEHFVLFNNDSLQLLKHYHPNLANEIITFRNERVIPLIKLLLRVGRKKKIISDTPDEIIIKVFTTSLGSIAQMKNNFYKASYQKTFEAAFEMLLNGILTKKGKQLLINKRINNESN